MLLAAHRQALLCRKRRFTPVTRACQNLKDPKLPRGCMKCHHESAGFEAISPKSARSRLLGDVRFAEFAAHLIRRKAFEALGHCSGGGDRTQAQRDDQKIDKSAFHARVLAQMPSTPNPKLGMLDTRTRTMHCPGAGDDYTPRPSSPPIRGLDARRL